ncbi:T9SS type A sorting domain-containing protein [Spirosoma validum]|uniref:T9SS type A sorting domain-containing protein n=1 Tax=Spirosoma validum TaxID=2771355 RepID=A0A927B829_9BACT|nr:hypothetical protein [Spirosoma validum]MBD2757003.1 hypothetical protein [Spirosoma validum]
MKTLIKSLALALTVSFATSAATFANPNPGGRTAAVASYQSSVYTTINGKLSIALDKQTVGAVDVRLKNDKGDVLYSQHLGKKESQYRTRLNLSELPDGAYEVEITNGVDKTTHKLTLSTKTPTTPSRLVAMN